MNLRKVAGGFGVGVGLECVFFSFTHTEMFHPFVGVNIVFLGLAVALLSLRYGILYD